MRGLRWGRGGVDADAVRGLYRQLEDWRGDVLLMAPTRAEFEASAARIDGELAGVDVVLRTSGSTDGTGRLVGLSRAALTASARATIDRLGGVGRGVGGQWVTSLPVHAVAGFQVVLRSVLAGHEPVVCPELRAAPLAAAVARLTPGVPHHLSLVPTQLHRLLAEAPDLVAGFDAVLVGGAALAPDLADRARRAGVRVVTTYGMTETSGGCVYDGVPLPGVQVRTEGGRVHIAGPVLATGYLDAGDRSTSSAAPFRTDAEGVRWLVTGDRGSWDGERLVVRGRADDVIISGGVNVDPHVVETALARAGGAWVVVGVPDAEWGQRVVAVTTGDADLARARAATAHLAPAERPKAVLRTDAWPLRPSGKVDTRAVRAWAQQAERARA
ncbi:AMP-binding protein [Propioniciclava soli]|uniref:AMP-binding protein n=1 Tax=Propioniciclava soli TaxID=2775081 RepID=UPI001E3EA549|nr:AMP-binding protein [Propioniciclava soli]